ncbi:hypothetical protein C1H46_025061 [Malus baccata]|uniref:Subtilisin-like protease fibronectin type-III domain-containing protein n=1 Tax=Malus baccata TaxID=106549 RepID=A0A540LSM7_MALBA|nr:hypothetical protein C1H46_025061 [Malus baccata]
MAEFESVKFLKILIFDVYLSSNIAHESLLLHSYKRTFNGFAAKLTEEEAQKLAGMDGVVSVFPSETKKLQTTRSWDFIGFPEMVKRSAIETDIIVGVIDSGIWPESASFSDAGFGPPPKRWKGACKGEGNFTCNNKIIGARYYRSLPYSKNSSDILSPRDTNGHGTHCASTAAGNLVSKASLYGLGLGTARGGVPSARIAVYKVCWSEGCPDVDILAAFDDAIADGVDILSVSIGGFKPSDYFRNSIDIGAFHALRKGIFTSASAGNKGPNLKTITNFAPWSLAVAASTIDRHFDTKVQLGNHKIYEGIVTNTFELKGKFYPIVYAADVPDTAAGYDGETSRLCRIGTLDQKLVAGKIVLCDGPSGYGAIYAGAFGYVLTSRNAVAIDPVPVPAASVWFHVGNEIAHYINSTRNPTATIWKSTEGMDALAPYVPPFSSRGPNPNTPNILKPDIASPGVSILAAWPPIAPVSRVEAKPMSANLNPEAEFAYGAGLINPSRAPYPGLVYDAAEIDYINFLCAHGYSTRLLKAVTGDSCSSSQSSHGTLSDHLNYPSVALYASNPKSVNGIFNRTVTNVGSPKSTYKAKVSAPPGLKIKVNPCVLKFTSLGQKLSFQITVTGLIEKTIVSGSLVWDDGKFQVRSPIVVYQRLQTLSQKLKLLTQQTKITNPKLKRIRNKLKHGIGEGHTFESIDADSSSRAIPTRGRRRKQRPISSRFCVDDCEIGIKRSKPNLQVLKKR